MLYPERLDLSKYYWKITKDNGEERNNGIHRKHDESGVLEVLNFGKYGYMKRIFTTERTFEEARQ